MNKREFHNALRILNGIGRHEVEEWMTYDTWDQFRLNPWLYFIGCDDETSDRLWAMIQNRQSVQAASELRADDKAEARKPDAHLEAEYRRLKGREP